MPMALLCAAIAALGISAETRFPGLLTFLDPSGFVTTFNTTGSLDTSGPFFQSLGTNGRSCATCHQASDAWSVTPPHIQARFMVSQGLDPIFRPVDGADCPSADVSSPKARAHAYSMLLNKGLIRVSIGVPSNATFSITGISDPHDCAETTAAGLALFRRPLPSANLPFLTTVMWDGRESFKGQNLNFDLSDQAVQATLGHAQASQAPSPDQVAGIVNFEMSNFVAQSLDFKAGMLDSHGAIGGPRNLSQQQFFPGINDPLGPDPSAFNPSAFTLFDNFALASQDADRSSEERAAIARGEALFNTLPITITGVTGLTDLPGLSTVAGTCTTCHNTPNVGNHSVPLAINIGITDYPALPALNTDGLPVYTVQCAPSVAGPIGKGGTFQVTDPGRALITGNCKDVGKTKGPILRGLAARAPYFHNGAAATLDDVLEFYKQRFNLNLTDQEKHDLVAFLRSL
ncbi:MAG: hypothetical protein JOZ44_18130 [Acidobacteria bacterium]|nr:hypothetical protein [Acidobacteriota bacterium]